MSKFYSMLVATMVVSVVLLVSVGSAQSPTEEDRRSRFDTSFTKLRVDLLASNHTDDLTEALQQATELHQSAKNEWGDDYYRTIDARWVVQQLNTLISLPVDERHPILESMAWLIKTEEAEFVGRDKDAATLDQLDEEAKRHYQVLLHRFGESHPQTIQANWRIATVLYHRDRRQFAEYMSRHLPRCESVWTAYHPETIYWKRDLASAYYVIGQEKKSSDLLAECIEDAKQFDFDPEVVRFMHLGYAKALAEIGEFDKAEETYQRVNASLVEAGKEDSFPSANCNLLLARLYLLRAEPEQAMPNLVRCVEFFDARRNPGDPFRITSRNMLAHTYRFLGNLELSEQTISKSLAECEAHLPEFHPSKATCYSLLGHLAADTGDTVSQEDYYARGLEIMKACRGLEHHATQTFVSNLGKVYLARERYSDAERLWLQSLQVLETSEVGIDQRVATLQSLADLYMKTKRLAEAEDRLAEADQVTEKYNMGDKRVARTRIQEVELAFRLNDIERAKTALAMAIEATPHGQLSQPETRSQILRFQGRIAQAEGDFGRSLERYSTAMDVLSSQGNRFAAMSSYADQKRLIDHQLQNFDRYCQAFMARDMHDETAIEELYRHVIQLKGQVADRQMMNAKAVQHPGLRAGIASLNGVNSRLSSILASSVDQSLNDEFKILVRRKNTLERKIAAQMGSASMPLRELSSRQVGSLLSSNEVFLDFVTFHGSEDDNLLVFLVRNGEPLHCVHLGALTPVIENARIWTAGQGDSVAAQKAGLHLRDTLWKPISKFISSNDELLISPCPGVGLISFGALPSLESDRRFLIEDHLISHQISARSLVFSRNSKKRINGNNKLLLLANPNFSTTHHADLEDLRGTEKEIRYIRRLVSASIMPINITSYERDEATLDHFLENAMESTHIHLATHGLLSTESPSGQDSENDWSHHKFLSSGCNAALVFANSPEHSGLSLLSAAHVANMDLSHVDQVVLSGCNTGRGTWEAAEGMASLQKAFHIAGARTVVSSLWPVPDEATCDLMTRFYKNHFQLGMTKGEALRQAQISTIKNSSPQPTPSAVAVRGELRKKETRNTAASSAYRWAGFILSGDVH